MTDVLLTFAACYAAFGVLLPLYDAACDDDAEAVLAEYGWQLILVMMVAWPLFMFDALRDWLRDR